MENGTIFPSDRKHIHEWIAYVAERNHDAASMFTVKLVRNQQTYLQLSSHNHYANADNIAERWVTEARRDTGISRVYITYLRKGDQREIFIDYALRTPETPAPTPAR